MNYVEWDVEETLFNELKLLDIEGMFDVIGIENLKFMYEVKYGDRKISRKVVGKTPKQVAGLLWDMYRTKWIGLYQLASFNECVGFDSKIIIDEVNSDESTKNLTTTQVQKNSVFNEDELVENSENDDSINEVGNKSFNKQYTQIKTTADAIDKERKLLENGYNINETMCRDIANAISLCIY